MSTRSTIAIPILGDQMWNLEDSYLELGEGYVGIYCHFDGYPDYVGRELVECYGTYQRALRLITTGPQSSIGRPYVGYRVGAQLADERRDGGVNYMDGDDWCDVTRDQAKEYLKGFIYATNTTSLLAGADKKHGSCYAYLWNNDTETWEVSQRLLEGEKLPYKVRWEEMVPVTEHASYDN